MKKLIKISFLIAVIGISGFVVFSNVKDFVKADMTPNVVIDPTLSSKLIIASPDPRTTESGLVGYWTFNGPDIQGLYATATDISGNGNNGTFGASPATGTDDPAPIAGVIGQALSFDGVNDYVDAGGQSSLHNVENGNFTVEAWIYPVAHISADGNRYVILGFYAPGWMVDLTRNSSVESYRFYTGSATIAYSTGGLNLPLRWQHIVWTVDSSYFTFYLDGMQKMQSAKTAITASDGENLRIGIRSDNAYSFNGLIDEVRIYNRALTAEEIMEHFSLSRRNGGI